MPKLSFSYSQPLKYNVEFKIADSFQSALECKWGLHEAYYTTNLSEAKKDCKKWLKQQKEIGEISKTNIYKVVNNDSISFDLEGIEVHINNKELESIFT